MKTRNEPIEVAEKISRNSARTKEHLQQERAHVDKVIENERARTDSAERSKGHHRLLDERINSDKELVSERLRTDQEIDQAAESLQVERIAHEATKTALTSREELLAIVSHDLRNPIGTIQSCADMLLDGDATFGINSEVHAWLELIRRNANSALRLVGDLLDIERFAAGKFVLEYEKNNLSDAIRQAAQSLTHEAAIKSILIRVSLQSQPIQMDFDRHRISQVLLNLISNAIKFTPEGGLITLSARMVDANYVQVSVSDTGPGIPEDKKISIFSRFSQLQNRDRRGLGLGLYISKSIIEIHKGKMWVESRAGHGSTFFFTLPTP